MDAGPLFICKQAHYKCTLMTTVAYLLLYRSQQ